MIYDSIQIFASDHRQIYNWSLPFIRISHSNEVINFASDCFLYKYKDLISEAAKMLFVYKHIKDFGNPNYIGFCHYRRYFAICKDWLHQNKIVIEDFDNKLSDCILSPIDQLCIIKKLEIDGILEFPFLDVVNANKYETIIDMFNNVINTMSNINAQNNCPLNIPQIVINHWIEAFEKNLPNEFKPYFKYALNHKDAYHSNIFTVKKEICDIYFPLLEILILDIIEFIHSNNIQISNLRWLSYIIEYLFSNIFFHIMSISRKFKFTYCQLLVQ